MSQMRIEIEELDLSMRAYNALRSRDVRFIDQIQPLLDEIDHPLARRNVNLLRVRDEIAEKLSRWRGDDGEAGAPVRR
jgi:hypothetical protein